MNREPKSATFQVALEAGRNPKPFWLIHSFILVNLNTRNFRYFYAKAAAFI